MGGVSWSIHKQLQDKSKKQENQITDLEKENEELKRRYEERLKEIQIQKELKEKQEREIQNKKTEALEDMTNSLKKNRRTRIRSS
jgi:hypothetical protein